MGAENLLKKLDKVRKTGRNKWMACCPAHDDEVPSLAVQELDDGRVLIHCHAGCGAAEVLTAAGSDFPALYPPKIDGNFLPRLRKPWNANDVLSGVAFEILVAWDIAKKPANGEALSAPDVDRLLLCATRLQRALEAANGR